MVYITTDQYPILGKNMVSEKLVLILLSGDDEHSLHISIDNGTDKFV